MIAASRIFILAILSSSLAAQAAESGGLVSIVNWYHNIASLIIPSDSAKFSPIIGALCVFLFVTVVGALSGLHRLEPEKLSDEELLPPSKFGFRAFSELAWAVVSSTLESVIGPRWTRFAPLLGGTFFFILIANLSGLIPGLTPPTHSMDMTLGMAIVIFIAFNYYGLKYAGLDYIKHLGGPLLALAPIIFCIEVIGLFARPVSLSLRLFGNISGDHLVFQVFSTLVNKAHAPFLPVPAALLFFGLLVACLQSFIFMTLSSVYIKLSIESAHHDDEGHH